MRKLTFPSNGQWPLKDIKTSIANSSTKMGSGNTEDPRIEQIVAYLIEKFNAPDSRRFYYQVARDLPQAKVAEIVEWVMLKIRQNGGCAGCLFNAVARKEMAARRLH